MRRIFTLVFFLFSLVSYSQTIDTSTQKYDETLDVVSFITILDIDNATKDGIYLNGYVVNLEYSEAKKLNGKKIRVTGKVTVVKGLENLPKEYDKNGNEIYKQGRYEDSKHITKPKIEIISN